MKFREELFLLFFIAVQVQCSNLSNDLSSSSNLNEEWLIEAGYSNFVTLNELCVIYEHLEEINSFLKPKYEKLIIVISDNINDAVRMAKYLSRNNSVQIEGNKVRIPYPLMSEILNILNLLYYNKETSTYIFAYHRYRENKILANYIAKKIIHSAENTSVILTSKGEIENDYVLDHLFLMSSNISLQYSPILFIPLNVIPLDEHKCALQSIFDKIKVYFKSVFNDTPGLAINDIRVKDIFLNSYQSNNKIHRSKCSLFTFFAPGSYGVLSQTCHNDRKMELFINIFFTLAILNIQTENGIISCNDNELFNRPEEIIKILNLYGSRELSEDTNLNNVVDHVKCTEVLLSNKKRKSLLFDSPFSNMTTLSDVFATVEFIDENMPLFEERVWNTDFEEKQDWFERLRAIFINSNFWEEKVRSDTLTHMYNSIPKYDEFDEEVMKKALSIVKSNTMEKNIQVNYSKISSTNCKLQIKGNFLRLSDIKPALKQNNCTGNVTFIELFSLDKVIIIYQFEKELFGEGTQINILAPIWEFISIGESSFDDAPAENVQVEKDTIKQLILPGQTGKFGTFFALIKEVINGNELLSCNSGVDDQQGGIPGIIQLYACNNNSNTDIQLSSMENFSVDESTETSKEPLILENFDKSIKRYKEFILTEIISCSCDNYTKLNIEMYKQFPRDYDSLIFINAITNLENDYSKETNKTRKLNSLEAWNKQFEKYLHRVEITKEMIETKALLPLNRMIFRKVDKLRRKLYDESVFNIKNYLRTCIADSKKYTSVKNLVEMKSITKNYTDQFHRQIEIANQLLSNNLQEDLNRSIAQLTTEFQEINAAIEKEKQKLITKHNQLQAKSQDLVKKSGLILFFGFLQVACLVLTFVNPLFAVVGATISIGASMYDSSVLNSAESKIVFDSAKRNYETRNLIKTMNNMNQKYATKTINFANNFVDVAMSVQNTQKKHTDNKSAQDKVNDEIKLNLENINNLKKSKEEIYNKLKPFVEKLERKLNNETMKLQNSSIIHLEYGRREMEDLIRDLKEKFDKITETFNVEEKAVPKIKNAMTAIFRLNELIINMKSEISKTQYSHKINTVPYKITNIQDEELQNAVIDLIYIHYANDIYDEFIKWKNSFVQYIFPFNKDFPDIYFETYDYHFDNSSEKANIIVEIMPEIQSNLEKTREDKYLLSSDIKFGYNKSPPFYTWNNSTYFTEIKQILEGKSVKLFADINSTNMSAVKFRTISILFTSSNETLNNELNNDLSSFSFQLIHHGDSHYRCDNDVYVFNSSHNSFGRNLIVIDYILSPYATWTITLKNTLLGIGDFKKFTKYVGEVNMNLVGDGKYFDILNDKNCSEYYSAPNPNDRGRFYDRRKRELNQIRKKRFDQWMSQKKLTNSAFE
ncbi:uncharacterized protein LOC122509574 [Leptopilina heterotoma]|uniref:uncharacterized protein LOC122509574 n=1 Tax=Leptopilina heterotoma TaxID=63436 RepID=UPI001CA87DBF|nr:uncharacterized protein LOC122509574 [Leptopilina heterotoma]